MENEVKQTETKSFKTYRDIVAQIVAVNENHIKVREMDGSGTFTSPTQILFPPYKQTIPEEVHVDDVIGVKICKERYWSPKYQEGKVIYKIVGTIDILS